jgi:phosphoribosylaminoimidazole-succinocarboxamide synthase
VESDRLPEPIFTPSTKADAGEHDMNISFDEAVGLVGSETAETVKKLSLEVYQKGVSIAEKRGIIIADTKFEFGYLDDRLILIDEVLTPDSSRFWPQATYQAGGSQKSYDKQYLRDYLLSIQWDKSPPAPTLPQDVVNNTRRKYMEALTQLTGNEYAFA